MTLLLVRHGLAVPRHTWPEGDELRPLSDEGTRQAHALVALAGAGTATAVLSSPARRCVDTVAPLARRVGLPVEQLGLLAEGQGGAALRAVRDRLIGDAPTAVVACTHGDVVGAILAALVHHDGLELPHELRIEEASAWVIEHDPDGRATSCRYRRVN